MLGPLESEKNMRLGEWIKGQIEAGIYPGRKAAYRAISEVIASKGGETVSPPTVEHAAGGLLLNSYRKAKALSEATDGQVTITELCE